MTTPILPVQVSGLDIAFGGNVRNLMPPMEEIPAEFTKFNGTKWNRVFGDFFYYGAKDIKWIAKEGIDSTAASRHVRAIIGSFEPKHENKEAACAYLMSLWFDDIQYTKGDLK